MDMIQAWSPFLLEVIAVAGAGAALSAEGCAGGGGAATVCAGRSATTVSLLMCTPYPHSRCEKGNEEGKKEE